MKYVLAIVLLFGLTGCGKSLGEIGEDFKEGLEDWAEDAIKDGVFDDLKDNLDDFGEKVQGIIDEIRGKK